jgi:hypothetical protein
MWRREQRSEQRGVLRGESFAGISKWRAPLTPGGPCGDASERSEQRGVLRGAN